MSIEEQQTLLGKLFSREGALGQSMISSWNALGCCVLTDESGQTVLQGDYTARCLQTRPGCYPALLQLTREAARLTGSDRHNSLAGQGCDGLRQQIAAPLCSALGSKGAVGVCIPCQADAAGQLLAQAELLSAVLLREEDLLSMTAELANAYDQLVSLYDVSRVTRSQTGLERLLTSLLAEAARLTEAPQGVLALEQNGALLCLCHPPACVRNESCRELLDHVRERKRLILANSSAECQAMLPQWTDLISLLAVPIRVGSQIVAAMGLVNKPTPYGFDAGNQKLLGVLAEGVETIVERTFWQQELVAKESLDRELEIAAGIQENLLPTQRPHIPGLDLAAECRPAYKVGGDFFDFMLEGDALCLMVGDVASHGLPAALLMPMVRTALRSAVSETSSPNAALARANESLYADLNNIGFFVTALLAYLQPEQRRVIVSSAGHPPFLLWRARQGVGEWWIADGPPLGVEVEREGGQRETILDPGDVMICYSDGFTEATSPQGDFFGSERMLETVRTHAEGSAEEILAHFFAAVKTFTGNAPPTDDLTLVIVKILPEQRRSAAAPGGSDEQDKR